MLRARLRCLPLVMAAYGTCLDPVDHRERFVESVHCLVDVSLNANELLLPTPSVHLGYSAKKYLSGFDYVYCTKIMHFTPY